jgi:hypothetical protein
MSKQMHIDLLCDWHQEEEREQVFAETVLVLVPGRGIREMELCKDCQKSRPYAEVVDLASRVGQDPAQPSKPKAAKASKPKKSKPAEDPAEEAEGYLCPERDCHRNLMYPFPTLMGRNIHLSRIHGYTREEQHAV